MNLNNQDDILSLIARYLSGTADPADSDKLGEWLEASGENMRYFKQVSNIWDLSGGNIDLSVLNMEDALKKVQNRIHKKSTLRTLWRYFSRIAAVLIILFLTGTNLWLYQKSRGTPGLIQDEITYTEVFAAFGTRTSLSLPDSTLVWLNSGSSLRYPSKFSDNDFKVFLKGEAYFDVRKKNLKHFIVQTSTLEVKVTGTRFNVQEYSSNNIAEIALAEGKVFVNELNNDSNQSKLIAELYPNQRLIYNTQTKKRQITEENAYRFGAWKDGKLIFRNDPLEEVVKKLSMMFNVEIEIRDGELKNYRYRATFEDESLEEILKLLKLSSPIDFREVSRVALPNGSFPKKKVIIYPSV